MILHKKLFNVYGFYILQLSRKLLVPEPDRASMRESGTRRTPTETLFPHGSKNLCTVRHIRGFNGG